jgi:hypothetical protein
MVVGFEVLTAVVMKSSVFWDITSCSQLKGNRLFGGTCLFHLQGRRINQEYLLYRPKPELPASRLLCFLLASCSSALKMKGTCFSETSVDFQRTTRCYVPEERTLYSVAVEGYCIGN